MGWNGKYYDDMCLICDRPIEWVACPTGGWWAHETHTDGNHDAEASYTPTEMMDFHGAWITTRPEIPEE